MSEYPNEIQKFRDSLSTFVGDNDLEKLEDLLIEYNIFQTLGISQNEHVHSRFLAWLFNPTASHGLGDWFLRRFLRNTLDCLGEDVDLKAVDIDGLPTETAEVETEDAGLDITIKISGKRDKFLCVIENKISYEEGKDQTKRYFAYINRNYPGWKHLLLFLTPEGHKSPQEKHFHHITYDRIVYGCLCELMQSSKFASLSGTTRLLLENYGRNLEVAVMSTNEEIDRLCQQIYKKHAYAIDRIIKVRQNEVNTLRDRIHTFLGKDQRFAGYVMVKYGNADPCYLLVFKEDWRVPRFQAKGFKFETNPRPFFTFNIEVSKKDRKIKGYLYVDQPIDEYYDLREKMKEGITKSQVDIEYKFQYPSSWRTREKAMKLPKEWDRDVMNDEYERVDKVISTFIEQTIPYITNVSKVIDEMMTSL